MDIPTKIYWILHYSMNTETNECSINVQVSNKTYRNKAIRHTGTRTTPAQHRRTSKLRIKPYRMWIRKCPCALNLGEIRPNVKLFVNIKLQGQL